MSNFIDLHCHYLPAVDDGVESFEQGVALLRALKGIGYAKVVCTPHIRAGMFNNRAPDLRAAFEQFCAKASAEEGLPELGLSAEHFCDDVFWALFKKGELLPYPGEKAVLMEFPPQAIPINVEQHFFKMKIKGLTPVLAHPERYSHSHKNITWLEDYKRLGVLLQLDLMALGGRYGRRAKKAAEHILEAGLYDLACSDCHRPEHVVFVQDAIERLQRLAGAKMATQLLNDGPKRVLDASPRQDKRAF